MKPYIPLTIILICALVFYACVRRSLETEPYDEAPLAVKLTVSDGMRTVDKVLRLPALSVTVVNGRDEAEYEALFRLDDGPERTVHSIWNGVEKDLSGELLSLTGYGCVSLKGYLIDKERPTERIPIDTLVWMAYAPALRSAVSIHSAEREETLLPGTSFTVGESGTLELNYTPEDTFLHVMITVGEDSPLVLLDRAAVNRGGHFSVPFVVMGEGESILTLEIENGRETETQQYTLVCQDPVPDEPEEGEEDDEKDEQ